jgi:hypothetical protein
LIPSEDDVKRQVIPRWRTIKATKDAGEFKSVGRESKTDLDRGVSDRLSLQFDLRLTDWREERDLAAAEELVGIAIVCGATDNSDVKAAAEGILKDPKGLAGSKELAVAILNLAAGEQGHDVIASDTAKIRLEIARRKRLIRLYPRDALLLTETALLYTNLGMMGRGTDLGRMGPAGALLRTAFSISQDNRYVLRSLTRFLVHAKRPELALHYLSKSAATRSDPWLVAAQLAAEDVSGQPVKVWRETKSILAAEKFSDFELAELRAAAGTLHLEAGSHKLARKMFRSSLTQPTENAVAQAQWASRRDSSIDIPSEVTPNAFEAKAWEEQLAGRWNSTIDAVRLWQDLEPFSVRPAVMGSFVAVSHLGDGAAGEAFSRKGLIANKGNSMLHNNLAVACAIQGKINEAQAEFALVKYRHGTSEEVVNLATRGLIAMRSGSIEEGVRLYNQAMDLAIVLKSPVLWCRAAANFSLEYARFDKSELEVLLGTIAKVYDRLRDQTKAVTNDVPILLERARNLQSASEIIEKLGAFRNQFVSYPVGEGFPPA